MDTVRLRDILGDPMIRECWQFNYLIDVDFLMSQFDEDVRSLVSVKVVHGSWKREAPNRIRIDVSRYLLLMMIPDLIYIQQCWAGIDVSYRKLVPGIPM